MTRLLLLLACSSPGADPVSRPIDYSRDVRPILPSHCFQCHGPDEQARKGRLRLDEPVTATKALASGGRAVVPGKPNESGLIERITTNDETSGMPSRKAGKRLTDREVASLRSIWRWRDRLIQALNDKLPYDRFTTERLAGDLLPGATAFQAVATGFHRVHDVQPTILHLLGLDHSCLTYRFQGRDDRLTDVNGRVVKEILA